MLHYRFLVRLHAGRLESRLHPADETQCVVGIGIGQGLLQRRMRVFKGILPLFHPVLQIQRLRLALSCQQYLQRGSG